MSDTSTPTHTPGCVSEYPSCLCTSCQNDARKPCCCERDDIEITLSDEHLGCGVVKCPEYLKEEASDHADT